MRCSHTCNETWYITAKGTGHHNEKFDDPFKAVDYLRKMPVEKAYKFGVTCVETYTYFDENGNFLDRETYEQFIDTLQY